MNVLSKVISKLFPPRDFSERDMASYINLEIPCLMDSNALITRSGARLTIITIEGFAEILTDQTELEMNKQLLSVVKRLYNQPNTAIAWSYESSNDMDYALNEAIRAGRDNAKKLGIDDRLYFDDVLAGNKGLCVNEQSWIAIWTFPEYEVRYEKGNLVTVETPNIPLRNLHSKLFDESANPFLSDAKAIKAHKNNYSELVGAFFNAGCAVQTLKAKKAAELLYSKLHNYRHKPKSLQYIDEGRLGIPNGNGMLINPKTGKCDYSGLFIPSLSEQIGNRVVYEDVATEGVVHLGDRLYATHTVNVMPQSMVPFTKLKALLRGIPYRITFMLGGKNEAFWDRVNTALNTFGRAAEDNRVSYNQMQLMRVMKENYQYPEIDVKILIVTWANDADILKNQSERIDNGLSDWGGASMDYDTISPWQTLCSSVAGINHMSHAIGGLFGADRIIPILPHQHPASIIPRGPIIMRHETGKPQYYGPNQLKQDYDLTLYLAKPRQGKSLLMNDKAVANLVTEGAEGINLVASLDIGPNAAGALQLMRIMLQEKHGKEVAESLVAYYQWNPSASGWHVNPLDINLGQTRPTPIERTFMVSFYSSVTAEPETGQSREGTADLLNLLINTVFEECSSPLHSIRYNPADSDVFNDAIKKYKIDIYEKSIADRNTKDYIAYFELRDRLFQLGLPKLAIKAHIHAMPTVENLIHTLSSNSTVRSKFAKTLPGLVDHIYYKLTQHASVAPHLSRHTTLDFQDAHIISFDLKPLTKEKNSKAGVIRLFSEYLLAMSISMRKFALTEDILSFPHMNPIYTDYWRERVNKYANLDKCLNLDEWHMMTIKQVTSEGKVISLPVAGAEYVDALIKEAPKWKMNINIATHSASDLTQTMRQKATNVFFYSGFDGEEAKELGELFNLKDKEIEALRNLHGPQAGVGTQMLHMQYINDSALKGGGRCMSIVEFLCTGSLLWALNTSARDLPHKLRLEREYGDKPWLQALIKAFPSGSMETMRLEILEQLRDRAYSLVGDNTIEERLYAHAVNSLKSIIYSEASIAITNDIVRGK
jgi:intracellular multiplication protein IcmB